MRKWQSVQCSLKKTGDPHADEKRQTSHIIYKNQLEMYLNVRLEAIIKPQLDKLYVISLDNDFFWIWPPKLRQENKNVKKMEWHQTKKLQYFQWSYHQSEDITNEMGEYIWITYSLQRFNIQG
jgi:hypothetical protein